MPQDKDFDVIVVGAGPAGSSCAYTLAKEGKTVLQIERGDFPGAKNVTGGRIYVQALEQLEPGLALEAMLERQIVREEITLIDYDNSNKKDYYIDLRSMDGAGRSFTVLRSKFDRWLADKAEEQGVVKVCGIRVDDLLEEDGEIVGIIAGEDRMYCDAVVAADGVNSLMAQKAGLLDELRAPNFSIGIKEMIELPAEEINRRFGLQNKDGMVKKIFSCTGGIHSEVFLYTNLASLSLGAIFFPEEAAKRQKSVQQLFQELKMHPFVYPLIKGGRTAEYAAHLVCMNSYHPSLGKLHKNGFLIVGDAAGVILNIGYDIRGLDLAIMSGLAAAQALIAEQDKEEIGIAYEQELNKVLLPILKSAAENYDSSPIPLIMRETFQLRDNFIKIYGRVDAL